MRTMRAYICVVATLISVSFVNAQTAVSIHSLAKAKPQDIIGSTYTPEGDGPFPAVVLLHGCGGIGQNVKAWAKFLQNRGYLALVLDSFTTRSINEICANTTRLSLRDRVDDAYGALLYLQSLPSVDKFRIGLMGFSHGSGVVLQAASEDSTMRLGDAPGFAAATALYPDCLASEVDSSVPLLIQSGEKDDWTAAAPCKLKVAARKSEGYPVEIEVYANALHSFDNPELNYYYGARYMNPNKPNFCCGASLGFNQAALTMAEHATESFFDRHLKAAESKATRAWIAKPAPTREQVADLVQSAKDWAVSNGKDKLIALINSQDAQFRKRRIFLAMLNNQGVCLANGKSPVAMTGFDYSNAKDSEGQPVIKLFRDALKQNSHWTRLLSPTADSDIYVERMDDDTILVGSLMK